MMWSPALWLAATENAGALVEGKWLHAHPVREGAIANLVLSYKGTYKPLIDK
jgi:hypothetical protein